VCVHVCVCAWCSLRRARYRLKFTCLGFPIPRRRRNTAFTCTSTATWTTTASAPAVTTTLTERLTAVPTTKNGKTGYNCDATVTRPSRDCRETHGSRTTVNRSRVACCSHSLHFYTDVNKTEFVRPRPRPIFWSETGLVLRPTVSDHINDCIVVQPYIVYDGVSLSSRLRWRDCVSVV